MIEGILVIAIAITAVFAVWTAACLVLKGMFKIADWVFGF